MMYRTILLVTGMIVTTLISWCGLTQSALADGDTAEAKAACQIIVQNIVDDKISDAISFMMDASGQRMNKDELQKIGDYFAGAQRAHVEGPTFLVLKSYGNDDLHIAWYAANFGGQPAYFRCTAGKWLGKWELQNFDTETGLDKIGLP